MWTSHFQHCRMIRLSRSKPPCVWCSLQRQQETHTADKARVPFFFFRAVLYSQQNWAEGTENSHILPAPHMHNLSTIHILCRVGRLLQSVNLHWHVAITQSPQSTLEMALCAVYSEFAQMNQDMYLLFWCQDRQFHTLGLLCSVCSSLPAPWQPLATANPFTGSTVLAFPKCLIAEIVQYSAFSDRLLPLKCV